MFLKREPRDGIWMYKCECKASTRRKDYLEALSLSVNRESKFLEGEYAGRAECHFHVHILYCFS